MQTEEIIGLMRGKAPYTDKTLSQLADVIEEYPYFQAAHLLHTLNLLQLKDTHFPSELRKTSAHLNDRRKLFFRVEDKSFPPEIIEILERTDEKSTVSTFDRIDFFLSGKEMTEETKDAPPVSSDYISYFLSKENKGEEKRESQPLQNQDAIERFLEKDKISPVKINLKDKETEKEDYISDLDTVDEDSFFSETLAKIYLKQKKYDKALEIIRKLNLIYPEKSRYFADQIRFLEKLIINTNKIK